jgi:hypothetical protein
MNDADTSKKADSKPSGVNKVRQEKVVEEVAKNLSTTGKKNVSSAMVKSDYSPHYARQAVADKTKTFIEKFNEIMPEEKILGWHSQLGDAKKTQQMMVGLDVPDEDIEQWVERCNCVLYKIVEGKQMKTVLFWARDNKAVKDAIEMAYKIRGDYAPDKVEDVSANPFLKMSDAELQQALNEAEAFLTKKSPNVPKTADTTESLEEKINEEKSNQGQHEK